MLRRRAEMVDEKNSSDSQQSRILFRSLQLSRVAPPPSSYTGTFFQVDYVTRGLLTGGAVSCSGGITTASQVFGQSHPSEEEWH